MCEILPMIDKYGVQWLLILALLWYIWHRSKQDDIESLNERTNWHSDIKANTLAITNLNNELKTMCKNRNA